MSRDELTNTSSDTAPRSFVERLALALMGEPGTRVLWSGVVVVGVFKPHVFERANLGCFHGLCVLLPNMIVAAQMQYTVNHQMGPMCAWRQTQARGLAHHHRRANYQIAAEALRAGRQIVSK